MSGAHPDIGPELRRLAQAILDGIDPAVRTAAAMTAGDGAGTGKCQQVWCPVCALAALATGDQHPLLTVVADHSIALLEVIRAIVGDDIDRLGATASGRPARRRAPTGAAEGGAKWRREDPLRAHPGHRRRVILRRAPRWSHPSRMGTVGAEHHRMRARGRAMWYWLFKYIFLGPCCSLCSVGRKSKAWNMFRAPAR